mgnify:CR=1 FL=1
MVLICLKFFKKNVVILVSNMQTGNLVHLFQATTAEGPAKSDENSVPRPDKFDEDSGPRPGTSDDSSATKPAEHNESTAEILFNPNVFTEYKLAGSPEVSLRTTPCLISLL